MTESNLVDQYINTQPSDIAERLQTIRALIHAVIPDTQESIRYNMPAFSIDDKHIYFAAYRSHIGMYPIYNALGLDDLIAAYRSPKAKDAVHFRHDEPLPVDIIEAIIARFSKS